MFFYDTEHSVIITREELKNEFIALKEQGETDAETFTEYIRNCLTCNNGTLEIVQ